MWSAYEATAPDVLAELTAEALDFKQAPDMQTRSYFKEARDKHDKLLGVVKDDHENIDVKLRDEKERCKTAVEGALEEEAKAKVTEKEAKKRRKETKLAKKEKKKLELESHIVLHQN